MKKLIESCQACGQPANYEVGVYRFGEMTFHEGCFSPNQDLIKNAILKGEIILDKDITKRVL